MLAVPAQQLWTPWNQQSLSQRLRRRWRSLLSIFESSGDTKLDASGNVLLNASGDVVECGGCGDCASIDDISVTFADITKCVCFDQGAYYASLIDDPNGTYTGFSADTPSFGRDCRFSKGITLTVTVWTNSSCTVGSTTTDATIIVEHIIASDEWEVTILGEDANLGTFYVFIGVEPDGFDVSAVTADNELTVCAFNPSTHLGGQVAYGKLGTATVEFICAA